MVHRIDKEISCSVLFSGSKVLQAQAYYFSLGNFVSGVSKNDMATQTGNTISFC